MSVRLAPQSSWRSSCSPSRRRQRSPAASGNGHGDTSAHRSLREAVTDQNFYFVMADRFDNADALNDNGGVPPGKGAGQSGFDPTGKGWYHGGDLKGLTSKIDYIKGLGTTAIWLTPSFKNKAVQPQDNSAGYHGYWITDFTQIDPHLGTNADLRTLVNAAHSRGIKVYFDIITNHTADVIGYGVDQRKGYTSKDQRPYHTASGAAFDDRDFADGSPAFPALAPTGQPSCSSPGSAVSFPYTPCVPDAERNVKVPSWLNDVSLYHNRGDTTFVGENSLYGDFFGLDDLFTENPRVVDGMTDIYKAWIRDFRIDGFRMDTMKHVNDEFWQKFSPAIVDYAKSQGIDDFYMFGEVAEDFSQPFLSHFTTHDDVQGVLDFPFQMSAVDFAGHSKATSNLKTFFENDDWYTDGDSNVYNLPTFLGNHDRGRIGMFLRNANPGAPESELLARDKLAHALMYFSRGNPVVYYGDEQGFTGAGGDQDARQDMFPSQSPQYNNLSDNIQGDDGAGKNDNIGSDVTPMANNFDPGHKLYRELAALASVTEAPPGAARRRPAAPVLVVVRGRLRVLAHPALAQARVRRRAQQLGAGRVRVRADVRPGQQVGEGLGQRRPAAAHGPRQGARRSLAPLSAVVYRSKKHIPRSRQAPATLSGVAERGPDRRGRRHPRELVLRGDVPRQGRQRRVEGHRHRRQRAVPRLPGHVRRRAGHAGLLQGDRARQRRAHALERRQDRDDPEARDHDRGAVREPGRAQQRRAARDRGARALGLRHDVPALRRRRRNVDDRRHRRLVAGLQRDRQPVRAARRDGGALPRRARLRHRHDDERHPHGQGRAGARDHDEGALQPAGRRLRRLGAAHLRRRARRR